MGTTVRGKRGRTEACKRTRIELVATGAVYVIMLIWFSMRLPPDAVPVHFDADGRARRLRFREELIQPLLSGLAAAGFGFDGLLIRHVGAPAKGNDRCGTFELVEDSRSRVPITRLAYLALVLATIAIIRT
jgi:hypothetical protein